MTACHAFRPLRPALLLCLALALPSWAAGVYSWRDADGKIHYSDTPPPESKTVRQIKTQPATANDKAPAPGAAKSSLAEQDQAFKKRRNEAKDSADKAAQSQADSEKQATACREMRGNLAALQSGQRMFRSGENGEPLAMEDQDRAAEIEKTQAQISKSCK